jgi:hypothetical protein
MRNFDESGRTVAKRSRINFNLQNYFTDAFSGYQIGNQAHLSFPLMILLYYRYICNLLA